MPPVPPVRQLHSDARDAADCCDDRSQRPEDAFQRRRARNSVDMGLDLKMLGILIAIFNSYVKFTINGFGPENVGLIFPMIASHLKTG